MKFNKSLALIHGYLCADGYVCTNLPHQKHKYYSIGLRNTCDILLKDFQNNFYQVFKIKPKLISGQRCRIYSKKLYYQLMENGPYHSYTWKYPQMTKEESKYWLRAFFDCEGWVICDKRKSRSVRAESVNRDQLLNLQKALQNINIKSQIYYRKNRNTATISIDDKVSLITYAKQIGFLHPKKQKLLQNVLDSFVNYLWDFNEIDIEDLIKNKAKLKKPYTIRLFSIKKLNLGKLQKYLNMNYNVESKIYKDKNGLGNEYYYLSIHKKGEVKKLISNNLINPEIINNLRQTFIKA